MRVMRFSRQILTLVALALVALSVGVLKAPEAAAAPAPAQSQALPDPCDAARGIGSLFGPAGRSVGGVTCEKVKEKGGEVLAKGWSFNLDVVNRMADWGVPGTNLYAGLLNGVDKHFVTPAGAQASAADEGYDPAAWAGERILPPWRWEAPSSELRTNDNFLKTVSAGGVAFQLSKMTLTFTGLIWGIAIQVFGWSGNVSSAIMPVVQESLIVPVFTALGFGSTEGAAALIIPLLTWVLIVMAAFRLLKRERGGDKRVLRGIAAIVVLLAMGSAAMRGPDVPLSPVWVQKTVDNFVSTVATSPAELLGATSQVETGFADGTVCASYVDGMFERYRDGYDPDAADADSKSVLVTGTGGAADSTMAALWSQMVMGPYKRTQFNGSTSADDAACILMDIEAGVPGPLRLDAWERTRGPVPKQYFSNRLENRNITSVVTAFAWCRPGGTGGTEVNPSKAFAPVNIREGSIPGGPMTDYEGLDDEAMCDAWWNKGDLTPGDASAVKDPVAVPGKVADGVGSVAEDVKNGDPVDPLGEVKNVLEDTGPFNFTSGQQVDAATKANRDAAPEAQKLILGVSGDVNGGAALAGAVFALAISIWLLFKLAGIVFKLFLFDAMIAIGALFLPFALLMYAAPSYKTQEHGKRIALAALTAPLMKVLFGFILYFFVTITGLMIAFVGDALGGLLAVLAPAFALAILLSVSKRTGWSGAFKVRGSVGFAAASVYRSDPMNTRHTKEMLSRSKERKERTSKFKIRERTRKLVFGAAGAGVNRALGDKRKTGERAGSKIGDMAADKLNLSDKQRKGLKKLLAAKGAKIQADLAKRQKERAEDGRADVGAQPKPDEKPQPGEKPQPKPQPGEKPKPKPQPKPQPGDDAALEGETIPVPALGTAKERRQRQKKAMQKEMVRYNTTGAAKTLVAGGLTYLKTGDPVTATGAAVGSRVSQVKGSNDERQKARDAAEAGAATMPPTTQHPDAGEPSRPTPVGSDGQPMDAPAPPRGSTVSDPGVRPSASEGSWGAGSPDNPWVAGPSSGDVAHPAPAPAGERGRPGASAIAPAPTHAPPAPRSTPTHAPPAPSQSASGPARPAQERTPKPSSSPRQSRASTPRQSGGRSGRVPGR